MELLTYLGLLLTGVAAGTLGGFVGIGGGILLIPALTLLFGYDQRSAQGMSLAVLVLPVALPGLLQYWKNPEVKLNLIAAGVIALGFLVGGYLGGRGANLVPDVGLLRKFFAVFLACTSVYLFLKK